MRARLDQEDVLSAKSLQRPVFGWGPWGEFRVNEKGEGLVAATDGLWIILFGKFGLPGLISFTALLLLPVVLLVWRLPARLWSDRRALLPVSLALVLILFMIDSLSNAMPNPIFVVIAGALTTVSGSLAVAGLPVGARESAGVSRVRPGRLPERLSPVDVR